MKKQTKTQGEVRLEELAIAARWLAKAIDEGLIYSTKDVAALHDRIKELETENALLKEQLPDIPEHGNIRGKEYYK